MATSHLRFVDGQTGYRELLRHVHETGEQRRPRGLTTFDAGYTTVELLSPYHALPVGVGRQLSRRVAAAEAIQLIGGFSSARLLLEASPNFQNYVEPEGHFHGAYGRRIGNQLSSVYAKLRTDPDTRQAIIALWDTEKDNEPGKRDYPCTIALGFSIRRGKLELDVTMRSNDVWRGFPYDIFQFTQLQLTLAHALRIEPGHYRHHTYSLHLYETDVDATLDCYLSDTPLVKLAQPTGFGTARRLTLYGAMKRAKKMRSVEPVELLDDSERWYWNALHPGK